MPTETSWSTSRQTGAVGPLGGRLGGVATSFRRLRRGDQQGSTAATWPMDFAGLARSRKALEDYVRAGGGLVNIHAANNAFLEWPAYSEMIGLGWRDPSFGESLIVEKSGKIKRIPAGEGRKPGHGPSYDFVVTTLAADHPIYRGIPKTWLHPFEQLTHGQHGPAKNLTVLNMPGRRTPTRTSRWMGGPLRPKAVSTRRCSATPRPGASLRIAICAVLASRRCWRERSNGRLQAR
ncbi:MAG: ThuA domain-containing protein [Bryobacterales bacterium]